MTPRRGDIVILGNLAARKRRRVRRIIRARSARVMSLPPGSPGLNPVEKMRGKVKSILRSSEPRTSEGLHAALTHAFASITANDAFSFFESCGYTFI